MRFTPNDAQQIGLEIMQIRRGRKSEKTMVEEFHKHYGNSPVDVAQMWRDLCELNNTLSEKEKSEKGFKRFLAAI